MLARPLTRTAIRHCFQLSPARRTRCRPRSMLGPDERPEGGRRPDEALNSTSSGAGRSKGGRPTGSAIGTGWFSALGPRSGQAANCAHVIPLQPAPPAPGAGPGCGARILRAGSLIPPARRPPRRTGPGPGGSLGERPLDLLRAGARLGGGRAPAGRILNWASKSTCSTRNARRGSDRSQAERARWCLTSNQIASCNSARSLLGLFVLGQYYLFPLSVGSPDSFSGCLFYFNGIPAQPLGGASWQILFDFS